MAGIVADAEERAERCGKPAPPKVQQKYLEILSGILSGKRSQQHPTTQQLTTQQLTTQQCPDAAVDDAAVPDAAVPDAAAAAPDDAAAAAPDDAAVPADNVSMPEPIFTWRRPAEWFEGKQCLQYMAENAKDGKVLRVQVEYKDLATLELGVVWATPEQLRAWPSALARHGKMLDEWELREALMDELEEDAGSVPPVMSCAGPSASAPAPGPAVSVRRSMKTFLNQAIKAANDAVDEQTARFEDGDMCGYVGPMIWLLHNGTEIQLFEPLSSIFTDMEYVRIRYGNCRFIITAKSVDNCDFTIRCDLGAFAAWDVGAAYLEERRR
jgi:hypothetical protein